jgi:hypothetical protein
LGPEVVDFTDGSDWLPSLLKPSTSLWLGRVGKKRNKREGTKGWRERDEGREERGEEKERERRKICLGLWLGS